MEDSFVWMILLQVLLIALNAVFACAEIAVISMNDNKLARLAMEGDKRAVRLARLTSQPARFLSTIQVSITVCGFLGSAFAAENFSDLLVGWLLGVGLRVPEATLDTVAVVVITLLLSYFTLVFGELVPKRVAMRKAEKLALGMAGMLSAISKAFAPVVSLLTVSTNAILRLLGIDPNAEDEEVSEEEIRMMVDAGSEKGAIDPEEKQMIQNVFEFDDLTAMEIATHRTDLCVLWMDEGMEEWDETIHVNRHTLYPVCEDSIDNIVGILNTKDYFCLKERDRLTVMENAVREAYFVPESVKADVLFKNMKRSRNNMAVVLDEYGGVSGIVTINDLVEQLVGDLEVDENETAAIEPIDSIGEGAWRIQGSAALEDVSRALGVPIPFEQEEYDTFNGLIFDTLGTVPQDGTTVELQAAGMHIQVTEICDHQVVSAIVTLEKKEEGETAEEEKQRA